MILWSQTFLGSRWSWETQITVWLWISLNVQKTSENIRYCLFSVFYKALYSHVIYIFSILQRTLFLLSVACVVRLMQCSLPPSRRGPLRFLCASLTNLSSSDWYMADINCEWVFLRERRGLCDEVSDWRLLRIRVPVSPFKYWNTPKCTGGNA